MRKRRVGFTLVEVSLFLAVTGLLFLGVTLGVQNSIYQQRYNDVVQGFADFLRNVYDGVLNVQNNTGDGRHNLAIYGKLISFGEKNENEEQVVYVYDVIGRAVSSDASEVGGGPTLTLLKNLGADVVFKVKDETDGKYKYRTVGVVEMYKPSWGARIQSTEGFEDYKGEILVVRDPKSGTVRTFVGDDGPIEVNEKLSSLVGTSTGEDDEGASILRDELSAFSPSEVDFCVNPNGTSESDRRTDIRLMESAANASGVEIVGLDDESENGNRCNR